MVLLRLRLFVVVYVYVYFTARRYPHFTLPLLLRITPFVTVALLLRFVYFTLFCLRYAFVVLRLLFVVWITRLFVVAVTFCTLFTFTFVCLRYTFGLRLLFAVGLRLDYTFTFVSLRLFYVYVYHVTTLLPRITFLHCTLITVWLFDSRCGCGLRVDLRLVPFTFYPTLRCCWLRYVRYGLVTLITLYIYVAVVTLRYAHGLILLILLFDFVDLRLRVVRCAFYVCVPLILPFTLIYVTVVVC